MAKRDDLNPKPADSTPQMIDRLKVQVSELEFQINNLAFRSIPDKIGSYVTFNLPGTLAQTAGNYGVFFTAVSPVDILAIVEKHASAGGVSVMSVYSINNASSPVFRDILFTSFSLNATPYVAQTAYGVQNVGTTYFRSAAASHLDIGESLVASVSGVLGQVTSVSLTVYFGDSASGRYKILT